MKRGTPFHPKVASLAEELGVRLPHAVGLLEMLFHFTAQYCPQGDIGKYSDKRIAAAVMWHGRAERFIEALSNARLIESHPDARLVIHDWHDHCDDATRKRVERSGEQFLSVTPKVTGQCPEPTQTLSSWQADCLSQAIALPVPEPLPSHSQEEERTTAVVVRQQDVWFDQFWEIVWSRIGKGEAHKAFCRAVRTPEFAAQVITAAKAQGPLLRQHAAMNGHSVLHPATWLNQRRWEDDIEDLRRDSNHGAKIHPKDAATITAAQRFLARNS